MGEEITTVHLLSQVLREGQICEIKASWMLTNSKRYKGGAGRRWNLTQQEARNPDHLHLFPGLLLYLSKTFLWSYYSFICSKVCSQHLLCANIV